MAHLNEVTLIGNVGMKPEVRATKDGRSKIASFSLATTRRWKKDGVAREKTEWHRVKAFGPKAEFIEKYLEKGEAIWLRGELRVDGFTDKDGTNWKVSEVVATQIEFLGPRKDKAGEASAPDHADDEYLDQDDAA